MKDLKTIILTSTIVLCSIIFPISFANDNNEKIENLKTELSLSDSQVEQIEGIFKNAGDNNDGAAINQQIFNILNNDQRRNFREFCRNEEFITILNERLKLSDEQKHQIQSIIKSTSEEIKQLHENNSTDGRAMRDPMKNIMDDRNDKIKSILNDEQKTEFEKLISEQRQKEQSNRPPRREKK